jgi:hypothetical protein
LKIEYRKVQDLNKQKYTFEENGSKNNDLKRALSNNVLPHVRGNQILETRVRFSFEKIIAWRFSGEGERSKSVHNEVDPQHLNGAEGRFLENSST